VNLVTKHVPNVQVQAVINVLLALSTTVSHIILSLNRQLVQRRVQMVNSSIMQPLHARSVIRTATPVIPLEVNVFHVIWRLGPIYSCMIVSAFKIAPLAIMARAPTRPANLAPTDARPAMAP
jgi:uncharacterized membrane protein